MLANLVALRRLGFIAVRVERLLALAGAVPTNPPTFVQRERERKERKKRKKEKLFRLGAPASAIQPS